MTRITDRMDKHWIYNLADYRQIFALTDQELNKNILDYHSGLSSVNAELNALGHSIVSGDALYQLSPQEMRRKAEIILQSQLNDPSRAENWRHTVDQFLADYTEGRQQGRYCFMPQPVLPPNAEPFDLLLCTDWLFSADSPHSAQELMNQLCRLANEVRIFPVPTDKTLITETLGPLMLAFQQRNFGVEVRAVNYPQRRDATALLRVWAKECEVSNGSL